jgi:hypothetical protein
MLIASDSRIVVKPLKAKALGISIGEDLPGEAVTYKTSV